MMTVAVLGFAVGPAVPALGQVAIEDLLRQIAALQAQIAALQAGQPAAPAAFQFTRNLNLGVRGDDVVALQEFLRGTGHFPAGQAATGFFGPVTQRAVAAWQAANGVSPAAGFFGPLSRAAYNRLVAVVPPPVVPPPVVPTPPAEPTPTPVPPLAGAEGSFRNVTQLFDVTGVTLREGQADIRVFGLEFEAAGSDLRVERVDVQFAWATGEASSNRPWRYFDSVSLFRGTERIASRPAASSGDWSDEGVISGFGATNVYRVTFTGLNQIVRQGSRLPLYVGVSTRSTLDSADLAANWLVRIPVNGIRAVDATGINQFAPAATMANETVRFTAAVPGTLTLSRDGALNRDRVQRVDATSDTNNIEIANFTARAADGDVRVTSLTATTTHNFAGGALASGARRFSLVRDAAVIRTVTAPIATGTQLLTFSDLNFTIPAGTTNSFVIRMDARDTESGFLANGNWVQVTDVRVTAEEPVRGTVLTPAPFVGVGGRVALFDRGIGVALLDRTATATVAATGGRDSASFVIRFRVNAFGADAHILDHAVHGITTATGTDVGARYTLITDPATATTTIATTLTHSLVAAAGDLGTGNFIVRDGQTRDFTLTVGATASVTNAFARIGLSQIHWSLANQFTSTLIFDHGLGTADWETAPVELRLR